MFTTGQGGLNKDEAKAVKLYAIAAEQGYVASQHNLGALYEQGVGGPPELSQGARMVPQGRRAGLRR
ncbi:hypothetical protein LP420_20920 [Massilia sp. B-10]|nr:hypothetical protein LP420_20920 [Massilia sp. B-10]